MGRFGVAVLAAWLGLGPGAAFAATCPAQDGPHAAAPQAFLLRDTTAAYRP
jgi:hypothetical protein